MTAPRFSAAAREAAEEVRLYYKSKRLGRIDDKNIAAIIERHFAEVVKERGALREALRKYCVGVDSWYRDGKSKEYHCRLCDRWWPYAYPVGGPENHANNCLAAMETHP